MMRSIRCPRAGACLFGALALSCGLGLAATGTDKDRIPFPAKTEHEGRIWRYDPVFKDEEVYLEADLDGDGEDETVIAYVAAYTPPSEGREEEEGPRIFEIPKKTAPVLKAYGAFYKIFDRDAGGHWKCVRTLRGLDQAGDVRTVRLAEDAPPGLLIISGAGETYKDIRLYQWREGGYRLLDSLETREPFSVHASPVFHIRQGARLFVWDPGKGRLVPRTANDPSAKIFLQ